MNCFCFHRRLVRCQNGFNVEISQPLDRSGRPLNAARISYRSAEHLVAAADPENMSAASVVGFQINVPALRAEERQITDRRFRSRQQDKIGVGGQRIARMDQRQGDALLLAQRIKVIEIGDPRNHGNGDLYRAVMSPISEPKRIFGR